VFVRWGKSANGSPPRRRTVLTVLRHSYITHLIEFGYPERFAQDQAGHAYASTTAIYTGVSDEFRNRLLAKALRARHAGMWEDQP
jgi:integrase/recombinase XerD